MDDAGAATQPPYPNGASGEPASPLSQTDDWGASMDAIAAGTLTRPEAAEAPAEAAPTEPECDQEPVSYDRFQEALQGRQEAEERLGQVSTWEPALELLRTLGVEPAKFIEHLQQQALGQAPPQLSSEERFAAWVTEQDLKLDELTKVERISLQGVWRQQEWLSNLQAERQQAEENAARAQWQADLQSLETTHPAFKNPVLRDALLSTYERRYGITPNQEQLTTLAAELGQAMEAQTQAKLAEYQQQKVADAAFPVFNGPGAAPAPAETENFHELSLENQMAAMRSHRRAATAAA